MYMLPMCTLYSPVVERQALKLIGQLSFVLLLLHYKLLFRLCFHGPQGDETCSVCKGPHCPLIQLRLQLDVGVLSAAAERGCEGWALCFESKIVASLNRQL